MPLETSTHYALARIGQTARRRDSAPRARRSAAGHSKHVDHLHTHQHFGRGLLCIGDGPDRKHAILKLTNVEIAANAMYPPTAPSSTRLLILYIKYQLPIVARARLNANDTSVI